MKRAATREARAHRSGPEPPSLASNLYVLLSLFVLLGLSAGSAMIPMGAFNEVANIGIAVAKALLVLIFFMRLKTDNPLLRLVAGIGFAWLAILIALSIADPLTRVPLLLPPSNTAISPLRAAHGSMATLGTSDREGHITGNTQLPQFGTTDHKNGRDTRTGVDQLTDEQQKSARSKPAIDTETSDPAVSLEEAITGHVETGHSPPDAT